MSSQKKSVSIYLQGGLGNRLFQIAFLYAYAKNNNKKFGYTYELPNTHSTIDYRKEVYPFLENITLHHPIIFNEPNDQCLSYLDIGNMDQDIFFRGYFQNEKYFKSYRNDLLALFQLPQVSVLPNSIFIHIRRGDYLNLPMHCIDLSKYYHTALKFIQSRIQAQNLYVVSDDISFCKNHFVFENFPKVFFVEHFNELQTLKLMTLCDLGGVCSNSSFSWWGSYLNQSTKKMILFPSKWFNEGPHSFYPVDIWFEGSFVVDLDTLNIRYNGKMNNSQFWDKIDKVLYINLESRKDRQKKCIDELTSVGAPMDKLERFIAIQNPIGYIGCTLSHISCLKIAMERKYESVMIVEDDIHFTDKQWWIENSNKILDYSFDVFMIGVNLFDFDEIDENMIRVTGGGSLVGYIVESHYYEKLLQNYKEGLELLLKTGKKPQYTIDSYVLRTLQPTDQWLALSRLTVSQIQDYSDIERFVVNYDPYMLKNIHTMQKIQYRLPN